MCTAFPVLPPASHSADTLSGHSAERYTARTAVPDTDTASATFHEGADHCHHFRAPRWGVHRSLRQQNCERAASLSQNKALYKPREKSRTLRSSENSGQCGGVGVLTELPDTTQHTVTLGFQPHKNSFSSINMPVPPDNICSHLRGETSKTRGSQNYFLSLFFIQNLTKPIHYQGYRSNGDLWSEYSLSSMTGYCGFRESKL